jgi:hypothetical protein
MVDGRTVDRAQHAIGNVRGAGNLQEMAAGGHGGSSDYFTLLS